MCGKNIGHRGQRGLEVGFSDPFLSTHILEVLGTKSPRFRVHKKRPKHENVKKVLRTDCPHLPSPPSVQDTSFVPHLQTPYFGTSLIGPKLVGFLVGRTILQLKKEEQAA